MTWHEIINAWRRAVSDPEVRRFVLGMTLFGSVAVAAFVWMFF